MNDDFTIGVFIISLVGAVSIASFVFYGVGAMRSPAELYLGTVERRCADIYSPKNPAYRECVATGMAAYPKEPVK